MQFGPRSSKGIAILTGYQAFIAFFGVSGPRRLDFGMVFL
jgi:hypothetical protein